MSTPRLIQLKTSLSLALDDYVLYQNLTGRRLHTERANNIAELREMIEHATDATLLRQRVQRYIGNMRYGRRWFTKNKKRLYHELSQVLKEFDVFREVIHVKEQLERERTLYQDRIKHYESECQQLQKALIKCTQASLEEVSRLKHEIRLLKHELHLAENRSSKAMVREQTSGNPLRRLWQVR